MLEFMVRLQELRTPFLNHIVEWITILGEETVLIVFMCIIFWCINRAAGYKMIISIVFASASNAILKSIFNVDRPWVKDDRIVPIRQETALGQSMPSGHTQVGSSMWFSLSRSFKGTVLKIVCYVMMILIAVSRVYLGVHTPQDVLVALALAVGGVLLSHFIVEKALEKDSAVPFIILAAIAFVGMFFFKDDNYYKMTGLLIAMPLGFFLENKYIKFNPKTKFVKQILKVTIGFVVVLAFKEGLKFILPETLIFEAVRYFFVGFSAAYLVPLIYVSLKLAEKKA